MRIKVTEERECCEERDMKPVNAGMYTDEILEGYEGVVFCVHCGQHFLVERYVDAAGSTDTRRVEIVVKKYNRGDVQC